MENTNELIQFLKELSKIKNDNRSNENIALLQKKYNIKDIHLLLQQILNINKRVLKEYLTQKETTTKIENIMLKSTISPIEVEKIFEKYDISYIKNNYSKNEITDMYIAVINNKPLTANTKEQTIRDIYNYYAGIKRAKSIARNFRTTK